MTGLSKAQLEQFETEGYVKVDGLFDPERDLNPIIEEYKGVLDTLAIELFEQGNLSSTYADLPFGERITKIYAETGEVHAQYFDFSLPQGNVQHDTPIWLGEAVFNTMTHPNLLNAVESLIGPEIYSNPVQHVRIKPPESAVGKNELGEVKLGATNWHQDNGVILENADASNILTVWFPLTRATEKHGCLQVIPGTHRDGLVDHCPGGSGGLKIPEKILAADRAVPVPMERGDVLFVHKRTHHASLSNVSEEIRWSFDLRYNPVGQATGRDVFPGFVARSRANPNSTLRDPKAWASLWLETRKRMADSAYNEAFNRWDPNAPVCA